MHHLLRSAAIVAIFSVAWAVPSFAAGQFLTAPTYAAGASPSSVAFGDFNHDGALDFAVSNYYDVTMTVFLGQGDGTFATVVNYSVGFYSRKVLAADFNSDGIID